MDAHHPNIVESLCLFSNRMCVCKTAGRIRVRHCCVHAVLPGALALTSFFGGFSRFVLPPPISFACPPLKTGCRRRRESTQHAAQGRCAMAGGLRAPRWTRRRWGPFLFFDIVETHY